MDGVKIPFEVADAIVSASLKDHLEFMQKELERHAQGEYVHPIDLNKYKAELIPAFKLLIDYYGG
jgi:hypothetical protein